MSRLTILSVAYPLAPVRPDTAGGAEQILLQLDHALVRRGHASLVIAREDSRVAGTLIPTPAISSPFDAAARTAAQTLHRAAVERACRQYEIDLVHMHGLDFDAYLPYADLPVLATLHLPLDRYAGAALTPARPRTWFNCVSDAQARTAPNCDAFLPAIENGVDVDAFAPSRRKAGFALFLGRICAEKGVHLAIEAARRADIPLLIAGEVFPYEEHTRYFHQEIEPRLGRACRYIGRVGVRQKRRLLALARCVLIPSLADETSSLVARESLAAGTPAIAFARGALREVIDHGRTGFLVDSVEEMARRIVHADRIDAEFCRAEARRRFPLNAMTARYLQFYRKLTQPPMRAAG
ncbi:MAG TPA: glycosyltransferase family 4 protein [Rhizomicrobium sp.]